MRKKFIYLIITLLIVTSNIYSQTVDTAISQVTIKSRLLNEERLIYVLLPDDYNKRNTKYPVLYLLDGLTNYIPVSTSVKVLSNEGLIPKMIIVCIENTDRNRDMTPTHSLKNYYGEDKDYNSSSGKANVFLNFLNEELVKCVDSVYRTNNYRILSGHSMSALATVFALLNKNTEFKAFIAADPSLWWDNGSVCDLTKSFLQQEIKTKRKFFLGATISGPTQQKQLEKYIGLFNSPKINNIDFSHIIYNSENHMTVPLKCNYDALQFIYKDWLLSYDYIKQGRSGIDNFIKLLKREYDYDASFDESYLLGQGFYYIDNEQLDNAIQTLKLNIEYFPKSVQSYNLLANAYRFRGDNDNALISYRKVLEIDPNNKNAASMIKKLEIK